MIIGAEAPHMTEGARKPNLMDVNKLAFLSILPKQSIDKLPGHVLNRKEKEIQSPED
jgi:hypothetical protein